MAKEQEGWSPFFETTKESNPHETALKAIELFESESTNRPRFAVDLGCGMGRDTFELLRNGWRVLAIDKERKPLDWINSQDQGVHGLLETKQMGFEDLNLDRLSPDLINASYTLPFCPADQFEFMWEKIVSAISVGGRFSGQFFGVNDDWANDTGDREFASVHHTIEEVHKLLHGFTLDHFLEQDKDGTISSGEAKHWHVFHVVAQKI